MDEAREAISGVRSDFAAYTAWANEMAAIGVTEKQTDAVPDQFIPMEPGITDRAAKNVEAARAAVLGILEGRTSEGIGDTAFGLVQAGAEWLDHYRRTRDPESLFRRPHHAAEPGQDQDDRHRPRGRPGRPRSPHPGCLMTEAPAITPGPSGPGARPRSPKP